MPNLEHEGTSYEVDEEGYLMDWQVWNEGLAGVMAKEDDDLSLKKSDNWFMLDEVCINQQTGEPMYHTAILEDTMKFMIDAKEKLKDKLSHVKV